MMHVFCRSFRLIILWYFFKAIVVNASSNSANPNQYSQVPPSHNYNVYSQQPHQNQQQYQQREQQYQQYSNRGVDQQAKNINEEINHANSYYPPQENYHKGIIHSDNSQYNRNIYQHQGIPPPQDHVAPPYSQYSHQNVNVEESGNIFSKLKNSIMAAGAAISGVDQVERQDPYFSNDVYSYHSQKTYPSMSQQPSISGSNYKSYRESFNNIEYQQVRNSEGNFISKIKSFFNADASPSTIRDKQQLFSDTNSYMQNNIQGSSQSSQLPNLFHSSNPQLPNIQTPHSDFFNSNIQNTQWKSSKEIHNTAAAPQSIDVSKSISAEPQILIVDDSVVLIPKPRELFRKKMKMMTAGPTGLQVFSDFEQVLTKFKDSQGNMRCLGTAELLDTSRMISPQAALKLRQLAEEYNNIPEGMCDNDFETFSLKCQNIIATEGFLHLSNIPLLVKDSMNKLILRDGWKEAVSALSKVGVPLFIFSSGYGDLVVQCFQNSGGFDSITIKPQTQSYDFTPISPIPSNMRVISNYLRAGPDGTVRAFSSPIVHERNKNATTASRCMGMPLPHRPFAVVFGSHEDDIMMTQGVQGIQEQISVGFLELTEDLSERLPVFMSSFDVVLLGDASFKYCTNLLEEILQVTGPRQKATKKKIDFPRPFFGGDVM